MHGVILPAVDESVIKSQSTPDAPPNAAAAGNDTEAATPSNNSLFAAGEGATGKGVEAEFDDQAEGDERHERHERHEGREGVLALFDPGWLMLIAGVALIATTIIIPAQRELEQAQFFKSRVDAIAKHRSDRLKNYTDYIAALDRGDPAVVEALASRQKNMARVGLELILPARPEGQTDLLTNSKVPLSASTLPELEPAPLRLPEPPKIDPAKLSSLERWARDDNARPMVLLAGGGCILLGLLPWGRMFRGQE